MTVRRMDHVKRVDRVSTPTNTAVMQVQYGDPLGDGWSTARIVSVVVPILLVVSVIAYFIYLWVARRDLVRSERETIDRKWNGSGGTVYKKKGGRRGGGIPRNEPDPDDDDLYAPGYQPRQHAYGPSGGGGSVDSHTLSGSPEPSKFSDNSPRVGYSNLRAADSTYTLTDQPMRETERR